MPNNVINELVFSDIDEETIEQILKVSCNGNGLVDFEILVPTPINIWLGSSSSKHTEVFGDTGLDWSRRSWGTKWNAYGHRPIERGSNYLILRFETAWRPPYQWIVALFNTVKIGFYHNSFDEGASVAKHGVFSCSTTDDDVFWEEETANEDADRHLKMLMFGEDYINVG